MITDILINSRIETLENQVKDLQLIRKELQNKLLNSEKVIIEKNSMIKVNQTLIKDYSKKIFDLKIDLKNKESELDYREFNIELLNDDVKQLKKAIYLSAVMLLLAFGTLIYYIVK
jgi:chromosome segregation ATPase